TGDRASRPPRYRPRAADRGGGAIQAGPSARRRLLPRTGGGTLRLEVLLSVECSSDHRLLIRGHSRATDQPLRLFCLSQTFVCARVWRSRRFLANLLSIPYCIIALKGNLFMNGPSHPIEAVMPRRTLLSSEQRIRLFSIPIDAAEMARHFVLSTEDLTLVRTKRRGANPPGFAVQLGALRHPGRVLDPAEFPPEP